MTERLFDRFKAIDTDTHITESPDVWTSRVSTQKWGDAVPHVKKVEGCDVWLMGDQGVGAPALPRWRASTAPFPPLPWATTTS